MSEWTPAEKQAVTGLVAPYARSKKSAERRVGRLPVDLPPDAPWAKNVVGYTTLAEGQKALLAKHALEIDLFPEHRPLEVACRECQMPVPVRSKGALPTFCDQCRVPVCPGGCGTRLPRAQMKKRRRCVACTQRQERDLKVRLGLKP